MKILICCLAFTFGCVTSQHQVLWEYDFEEIPEELPLPPDPRGEDLDLPEDEDPSEIVFECPTGPFICITNARAARDALFRIRYNELRGIIEADREVWGSHRELYEGTLSIAEQRLVECRKPWWDDYKFHLGVGTGFIVGVGTAILLANSLSN